MDSKILNHPDREEMIQKLLSGVSSNSILKWLQDKYPNDKQHHITVVTLNKFKKSYLNLDREAVRLLKKERNKKELGLPHNPNAAAFMEKTNETEKEHSLRVKETLLYSPTYKEKLKEITDAHLDAPMLMKELSALLNSRIEIYYNQVASADSQTDTFKSDKMLVELITLMQTIIKDSKKIYDDYNSQPDEGEVNLNIVQEQIGVIRETVKELLNELDPGLALEFMDKLNTRLNALKYEPPKQTNILERVDKLSNKIREIRDTKK